MRIKLKTSMAGPTGCFPAGRVLDVNKRMAEELLAGNYAVSVETAEDIAKAGVVTKVPAEAGARSKKKENF